MSNKVVPFEVAGQVIQPGERKLVEVPISQLSNGLAMTLPVMVIHGRKPGPVLVVSAAVHGDEIIGVEVIRRLAQRPALKALCGTLLLVPVVNGYGFLNQSRYLPDRRDLNRCFPGSVSGSLAARLADTFIKNVVARADYGIDLHSAASHRSNLPQIRVAPNVPELMELGEIFGAPAILYSSLREGSLRQSAMDLGVPVLLFEGGEGLRFDEKVVRAGLAGTLRVMRHVGMLAPAKANNVQAPSFVSQKSSWLRAPEGGLLRMIKDLGDFVHAGERIGMVSDLLGDNEFDVVSRYDGLIVGRATMPVVNEGDAIAHIALGQISEPVSSDMDAISEHLDVAKMFYEDEII